jgi:hypothetical protein
MFGWWDGAAFVFEYWYLFAWGLAVIVAYVIGGWSLAAAVATLGAGASIYTKGRRDALRKRLEQDLEITRKLDEKFNEIDERGATTDDVVDRLSDGKF